MSLQGVSYLEISAKNFRQVELNLELQECIKIICFTLDSACMVSQKFTKVKFDQISLLKIGYYPVKVLF